MTEQPAVRTRSNFCWELTGLLFIFALTVFYLSVSWLRWPDPMIDFGRELYTPWRLSQGAVILRDVDSFFGPLSQYFNSVIFRVFGPGLIVLVWLNLTIFAAICGLEYFLIRSAWGIPAALLSLAIFVSIFAFGQYVGVGNGNYAAPYSHEAIHGVLVCLALAVGLRQWLAGPTLLNGTAVGFLAGLTAVLKLEILFSAGAIVTAAVAIQLFNRQEVRLPIWAAMLASALLPTAGFLAYFSTELPVADAVQATCNAWLTTSTTAKLITQPLQQVMLGVDRPLHNLAQHCLATGYAVFFFGTLSAGASIASRQRTVVTQFLVGAVVWIVSFWLVWTQVNWISIGRCFLGLVLLYLCVSVVRLIRTIPDRKTDPIASTRLLIAILAASLMARMFLNGRIEHYGFYQAALAGMIIPAVVLSEIPEFLKLRPSAKWFFGLCLISWIAVGVSALSLFSIGIHRAKTMEVGKGPDRFYVMPPSEDPMGLVVNTMLAALEKTPTAQTLLVLPEGIMLNYLCRKPSPVSPFFLHSATTYNGKEKILVRKLEQTPPDLVLVISRDLSESGIIRYGDSPGSGQDLLAWVDRNYELSASIGSDPFERGQRAARLYTRKPSTR